MWIVHITQPTPMAVAMMAVLPVQLEVDPGPCPEIRKKYQT